MSLAESLNWEQEEQCTSVFPRSVTNRKNQENLKLSEKKELLKKRYSCRGKMDYLS